MENKQFIRTLISDFEMAGKFITANDIRQHCGIEPEPAEDWPAKYRDLKIRAVSKNAGLIRAILRIKNMIHLGGFVGFYAEAIKRVIEESQNEFTFNQAEPPEPETGILSFAEAQPDFSAERAELVTTLNKIVYHYRNGRGKKLAKAIWNADKLIQEYV
jgi:hypothetical protein